MYKFHLILSMQNNFYHNIFTNSLKWHAIQEATNDDLRVNQKLTSFL